MTKFPLLILDNVRFQITFWRWTKVFESGA